MSETLYTINDEICVEAKYCTYQEFKNKYDIKSDEYPDLERGFDVDFPSTNGDLFSIFVPVHVWNQIAHEY